MSAPIAETWTSRAPNVGRRARDGARALGVHRLEPLAPALEQDADEVDDRVGIARRRGDGIGVAQVRLHGVDLADPAERLQVAGQFRPAHRDADAIAPLAERADHVAAENPEPPNTVTRVSTFAWLIMRRLEAIARGATECFALRGEIQDRFHPV